MKTINKLFAFLCLCLAVLGTISACAAKPRSTIVIFAAGSLMQPFREIEKAFEAKNPQYDLQIEYHGSIQVMRHVTDLHEPIDIVATADETLIPMLMYATNDPATGKPYANWYTSIATNKLAIAYQAKSKYADEITAENWWQILSRPDVRVGLSDPRFDAVGYRQLMVFALAQALYRNDQIFSDFLEGQFTRRINLVDLGDMLIIRIPEILETTGSAHLVMRGSSIALNALLEAGEIDYAFEYESVIKQQGFEMLDLPAELNLGDESYETNYNQATVQLDFRRFASVEPVFSGELIRYGLTIPESSPNPEGAERFFAFFYGEDGQKIMADNYHPLIMPIKGDHLELMPETLKGLIGD